MSVYIITCILWYVQVEKGQIQDYKLYWYVCVIDYHASKNIPYVAEKFKSS